MTILTFYLQLTANGGNFLSRDRGSGKQICIPVLALALSVIIWPHCARQTTGIYYGTGTLSSLQVLR